jgi:hypothetical protein
VIGRNGHVAVVEEGVELPGEEQAVLDMVAARAQVGLDVCGVQDQLGALAGEGAAAAVACDGVVRALEPEEDGGAQLELLHGPQRHGRPEVHLV